MTTDSPTAARRATASGFEVTGLSGLELVAGMADGSLPRPPMAETFPFAVLPPEEGMVRLMATPEPRFLNPANTIHGGWTMTMLDSAMALAAMTTLAPGEISPTHETTAKFVRPITVESGVMHIIGQVVSRGRTVVTVEGRVEDAAGRLHAHGASTCLIVRRRP